MSDTKTIEKRSDKDILMEHRNNFQKQLMDNLLDLRRHEAIKAIDPNYQRQNPQSGKYTSIDELIENYRKAAANAKSYVQIIDDFLQKDESGSLSSEWENVELVPFPISFGKDEGKEDEGKEAK
jgi:hypothetical protein